MKATDQQKRPINPEGNLFKRLGWMVLLWFGGVFSLFLFVLLVRFIMSSVGLTTH